MQITVTDNNEWEGESFSFVLELPEKEAYLIKRKESQSMKVELNTSFNKESIELINSRSDNGYMSRIQFAQIKDLSLLNLKNDLYDKIFYKGCGLNLSIDN